MRITVMKQTAKGLPATTGLRSVEEKRERLRWFLWHGNVFMALRTVEGIEWTIEEFEDQRPEPRNLKTLAKAISEFKTYISRNRNFIPNCGDRYRYGEAIPTAFAESTVSEVVSKRILSVYPSCGGFFSLHVLGRSPPWTAGAATKVPYRSDTFLVLPSSSLLPHL
jgi:hypothetical protein